MSSRAAAPSPALARSLAVVWRSLRSMRTALVLLLMMAVASIAGSLVPQEGVAPLAIEELYREHPLRAEVYRRLGLFDVYGSWWFTFIYVLLLVSLVACLLPRSRAAVRNLRARPQPTAEIDGFRHRAERAVPSSPERAIAAARGVLRRRLFRLSRPDPRPALAADKGLAREVGSLLFHWAFLLIVVGIVYGKGTGFTGQAVIVEGQTWTEAEANYDGTFRPGRLYSGGHSGIQVHLRDFEVRYRPTGMPEMFASDVELRAPDGSVVERAEIRVNHPASIEGIRFFQFGYGWAPVIEVRRDGEPIAAGPVVFRQADAPAGVNPLTLPWEGVLKLPSLEPQVGIRFQLWPDSRALVQGLTGGGPALMLEPFQPVMTFTAYRGDLQADRVQNIAELDTSRMREWRTGVLGAAETKELGDGLTMSFPDLREYTVLQVSRDRGLWIMLAAAILILVGLLPALYTSRRRIWVNAEPHGSGAIVRVGGFSLQRRGRFEGEFARLVDELARAAGGDGDRPSPAVEHEVRVP